MSNGLAYFPFDVTPDDKWELIEAEFGLKGFAILVKLHARIYGNYYYCDWNDDIALLFSKKTDCSAVSDIVSASIRRGIFDERLYKKYHILTSKLIQERYFFTTQRRKEVIAKKEYLLFDVAKKHKNVTIITENVNIFSENDDISEQRKVKESKGKENKINNSVAQTAQKRKQKKFIPPSIEEVQAYCEEIGYMIDAERFVNYYESSGWKRGNTSIKDWKACVRTWKNREYRDFEGRKNHFNRFSSTEEEAKERELEQAILQRQLNQRRSRNEQQM